MDKPIRTAMELSLQFSDSDRILDSLMMMAKHNAEECRDWALTTLGDNRDTQTLLTWVAHRTSTQCHLHPAVGKHDRVRHTR